MNKIQTARKMLLDYLKEQIALKGLSQYQISELTGFTQGNISRLLKSKYSPSLDNFIKICNAIGVDITLNDKK